MDLAWDAWQYILVIVGSITGFIILIILTFNISKYFRINSKIDRLQLPELRKTGVFVDGETKHHTFLSNQDKVKKVKKVIIAVHDFFGCNKDFEPIVENERDVLVLAYNQRGYDKIEINKRLNVYIKDLNDFIESVNKKYKNSEIEVLFEGYACGLLHYINKQNIAAVSKIHFLNPITDFKNMSLHGYVIFRIGIGFLVGYKKNVLINIDYNSLTFNKNVIKYFKDKKIYRNILELSHMKKINKRLFYKSNKNFECIVYQSKDDLFFNEKKYQKLIQKINAKEILLQDEKHIISKPIWNND